MKIKILAICLILFSIVSITYATNYPRAVIRNHNVQKVIVNEIVPIYEVVPNQHQDPFASQQLIEELRKHTEALKSFTQVLRTQSLIGGNKESKFVGVLRQNCASCHSENSPKGGFQIFSGNSLSNSLSPSDYLLALQRIYKGEMPPKGQVNDEDFGVLLVEGSQYFLNQGEK